MKIIKREGLFYKKGYELKPLDEEQAINLSLDDQVYVKINDIAYPAKIVKCWENAPKFGIEIIK